MNEKEIIKGKTSSLGVMCFVLAVIVFLLTFVTYEVFWNNAITAIEVCFGVGLIVIGVLQNGSTIIVTDKRVSGKTKTGKQVDIPLNMISSVGSSSFAQTVSIASSSGRMSFCISNAVDVANEINKLLISNQDNASKNSSPIINQVSSADELKQYKELLDSGVITQEEFDAKKKQLLGL